MIAVLTGRDLLADGLKPIPLKTFSWHPAEIPLHNTDGSPPFTAPDFPLPHDKARFVGEAVAMVVAETVAAAKDGAEQVAIDYEPLPCVTFAPDAAKPGAPLLHEHHGSNVCIDAQVGDGAGDRGRLRARRARREARDLDAARHRRRRWSRARRSAEYDAGDRQATRSTPAAAAPRGCKATSPRRSACPTRRCGS